MISSEEVRHSARLARIQLSDEEAEKYQNDLSAVFDYFEILKKVDTENVQPMTHSVLLENVAQNDAAVRERPEVIQRLMRLMPAAKNGFLKVGAVFLPKKD